VRNHSASQDPFRRRPLFPTLNLGVSSLNRPVPEVASPANTTLETAAPDFGAGTVWNIGNDLLAPVSPTISVPDGHGGQFGSGTNAPMYASNFLDMETSDQCLGRFESRLAIALDIDQTRKVLNFALTGNFPRPITPNCQRKRLNEVTCTVWVDGQWVNEPQGYGKYCPFFALILSP
jgi:hypothetical protein